MWQSGEAVYWTVCLVLLCLGDGVQMKLHLSPNHIPENRDKEEFPQMPAKAGMGQALAEGKV